mgnify:CR=1 FL=1
MINLISVEKTKKIEEILFEHQNGVIASTVMNSGNIRRRQNSRRIFSYDKWSFKLRERILLFVLIGFQMFQLVLDYTTLLNEDIA